MIRPIVKYGADPALARPAATVEAITPDILALIDDIERQRYQNMIVVSPLVLRRWPARSITSRTS